MKKLVKREKDKRSTTLDKGKGSERTSEKQEYNHTQPVIRPQSALSIRDDTTRSNQCTPKEGSSENYRKDASRPSSNISQNEQDEYATFRYDDIEKEREGSYTRDASILVDKSRARSTSLHDTKPQIGQLSQERRENRLPEDKKKQIDQGKFIYLDVL